MIDRQAAETSLKIAAAIKPHLGGLPPQVQSAVLLELMATFVVGHIIPGDPAKTSEMRALIVETWVEALKKLVVINAAILDDERG